MEASLKTKLLSHHQASLSYRYGRTDGEDDHSVSVKYGIDSEVVECSGRMNYSITDNRQEILLLTILKADTLRLRVEAKINFTDFRPDAVRPVGLKIGAECFL